jgi:hypothetical protein
MRFLRIIGILVLGMAVIVWCFNRPAQSTTNTVRPSTSKAQPEWLRRAFPRPLGRRPTVAAEGHDASPHLSPSSSLSIVPAEVSGGRAERCACEDSTRGGYSR